MAEKKMVCQCGLPILLPPIQVHRVDATGNWELVEIIGEAIR